MTPGRHVRRQGADRRLPDAWRRRCAPPRWPGASRPARCGGAGARADLHGQPARLRGRQRLASGCCGPATGRAEVRRIEAGLRAGLAPLRGAARGRRRAGARRDRRGPARPRRWTCAAATAAAVAAGRVAAPVPGPDLHDAAVRRPTTPTSARITQGDRRGGVRDLTRKRESRHGDLREPAAPGRWTSAVRCASASTRTPRCWPAGGCPTTSAGLARVLPDGGRRARRSGGGGQAAVGVFRAIRVTRHRRFLSQLSDSCARPERSSCST